MTGREAYLRGLGPAAQWVFPFGLPERSTDRGRTVVDLRYVAGQSLHEGMSKRIGGWPWVFSQIAVIGHRLEADVVYRIRLRIPQDTRVIALGSPHRPMEVVIRALGEPAFNGAHIDAATFNTDEPDLCPIKGFGTQNPVYVELETMTRDESVDFTLAFGISHPVPPRPRAQSSEDQDAQEAAP